MKNSVAPTTPTTPNSVVAVKKHAKKSATIVRAKSYDTVIRYNIDARKDFAPKFKGDEHKVASFRYKTGDFDVRIVVATASHFNLKATATFRCADIDDTNDKIVYNLERMMDDEAYEKVAEYISDIADAITYGEGTYHEILDMVYELRHELDGEEYFPIEDLVSEYREKSEYVKASAIYAIHDTIREFVSKLTIDEDAAIIASLARLYSHYMDKLDRWHYIDNLKFNRNK